MKTKHLFELLVLFSLMASPSVFADLHMKQACRTAESWNLSSSSLDKEWIEEFKNFLTKKTSATRGFSEALALRRQSIEGNSEFQKQFSEYWISRALFATKSYHQAHFGFAAIVKNATDSVIKMAAIQCLGEIQKQASSLTVPTALPWELLAGNLDNVDAIFLSFLKQMADSNLKAAKSAMDILKGNAVPHSDFAEGVYYSKIKDYSKSVIALERFYSHPSLDEFLKKYRDSGRILMGRAYYALKKYSLASKNFQMIQKNSNELTEVLSELSWAYLMAGQYEESVGVVMQLRARGFKNTFTPEASMVSAMAFNELCQYPASLSALHGFKKDYATEYAWLKDWSQNQRVALYSEAVQFVRGKKGVPVKIGNEWIRSPVFLTRQSELNRILKQASVSLHISQSARLEYVKMRTQLTASIAKFISKYRSEKSHQKSHQKDQMNPGESFSPSLLKDYQDIRTQFVHFYRLKQGAKPWNKIAELFQGKLPQLRERLVSSIEKDLALKNRKMLSLLQEIAENNELISAEIYTGASQDLVWKNAHPDFVQVVKEFDKNDTNRRPASEVWNWGKVRAAENEDPEVWEDEVGFAKADLADNCADKEKYLKVKASGAHAKYVKRTNQ